MVKRNANLAKLSAPYLFSLVGERLESYRAKHPDVELISLSIGDTTEPIPKHIVHAMRDAAEGMGTMEGYHGYCPFQGVEELREKIASVVYKNAISADDVFISDGAKPDIGRLPLLFSNDTRVAVQNPAYPPYVDTSVVCGRSDQYNPQLGRYEGIFYLECTPENNFCPDFSKLPAVDLIYFCSPNNPTGTVATHDQLRQLVDYAKRCNAMILFDSAYAAYNRDPSLPKTIYEVEGANEVAIEVSSFSKVAGFTGLRLGWSVIPKELKFEDGSSVQKDWSRIIATFFNGASYITQIGGLAVLDEQGLELTRAITDHYLENAKILRESIQSERIYGGVNTPYLWVEYPGRNSWDVFQEILEQTHIVTTPGVGFGSCGQGFLRFSAFGHRETIIKASQQLKPGL